MGLIGRGAGGDRYLANKVISLEAAGNNCGVRHREANLQAVYRGVEDGGIQIVPQALLPRTQPHRGGERFILKDK